MRKRERSFSLKVGLKYRKERGDWESPYIEHNRNRARFIPEIGRMSGRPKSKKKGLFSTARA